MKIVLIRHGVAEDQEEFAKTGAPDEQRPLTAKGRDKMRAAARGLTGIVNDIDVIAASPLTRAQQTADIVANEFPDAARETIDAMTPDAAYEAFVEWTNNHRDRQCVATVGHDPHISGLAAWLIGASDGPIEMKKGSALLVEFDGDVRAGSGKLRWFVTPKQMRKLSER